MFKKLLFSGLIFSLLLNLFSAPLSMLIYELNQLAQAHGNERIQEFSITVCETSCTVQKTIQLEQNSPAQTEQNQRISFQPLAFFFQKVDQAAAIAPGLLSPSHPLFNEGLPKHHSSAVFVPPRLV